MIKKAFIDVETGGLDPKVNPLLELGCIFEIGGIEETANFRCRPYVDQVTVKQALDVNGYTQDEIETWNDPAETFQTFKKRLSRCVNPYDKTDKMFLIGYNVKFDEGFIRAFFSRNGDKFFSSFFHWPSIDVAVLAATAMKDIRHKMPNFKLATVAKTLGIEVRDDKLHGASYDIALTREIFMAVTGEKSI